MKKKIIIALLAIICVFSTAFAIGINQKTKPIKAEEISFSSTNYYQGITAVNERFSTIETTVNVPSGTSTRGCIIGNYPSGTISFNSDFFSLETKANGTLRYFFRLSSTNGNSECTFDYDLRGKGDVAISITHTRSTGAVTAVFTTSTETVTKTGTVSAALDTSLVPNSLPFCVGNDYRKTTCPFAGTIKNIIMKDASGKLILSYNLQGKGGYETIKDESGNGHDLKLVKGETVTLAQTNGITFDKAGEIYQTNNVINDNINGIETWINVPTSIANDVRPGVIWGNYNTISGTQNCLSFEITTNGNPRFYARYNTSNHITSAVFNEVDVRTGTNLHLSIFFDRNAQKAYCYINGVLKQIITISVTNKLDNSDGVDITDRFGVGGDYRTTTGQPPEQSRFKGTIYTLAVFGYGRPATNLAVDASASQITNDMTSISTDLQGLVALYDFNGKQGYDNIKDLSGNGNHLVSYSVTEENPTFIEDNLLASSKAVTVPVNTVEAWIKMPKSYSGRGGVIIGNYCDTNGITDAFSIEVTAEGQPRVFTRYNNGDDSRLDIKFNYDVRTNEDIHLAITLNRDNQVATLYINGRVPDGCLNVPFTYISGYKALYTNDFTPGSYPFVVGNDHRNAKVNSYFRGTIYSVALFSDIRTQAEVVSDIEKVNVKDANIVLAYDLKNAGTSPTSIKDLTSNGYDVSYNSNYIKWEANTTYQTAKTITSAPKTIEATIKIPASYTERAGVITGTYGGGADAFGLEVYTNGNPRLFVTDSDGTNTNLIFTDVSVATGAWVHIAMVVDGTNVLLYINGTYKSTKTFASSTTYVPTFPFGVGGDLRSGNACYFNGLIKNVAVYSDVRTATEISSDASATSINTSSLLFGYNLTGVNDLATIQDISSNDNDLKKAQYWITDNSVTDPTDYDYSFAVVGDTQKLARQYSNYLTGDTTDTSFPQSQTFPKIYDYIINNAQSKNIKHVFGLGDITETGFHWGASETRSDHEFILATEQFARLDAAGIDYSLVRGNHDAWSKYNQYLGTGADNTRCNYTNSVDEYYTHPDGTKDYANSIHYFSAGDLDYMTVTLDYGCSDNVLAWAKERILANPYKNAIITTHAYMFRDGTTLDVNDVVPPTSDLSSVYDRTNVNNGDDLWNELISQCPNIVLAMSGHDPCDNVVLSQWKGVNGNTVSNMLIDPQGLDDGFKAEGSVGAVAMFYFSNGGKTVEVRFWSTARNCYIKTNNQYTFEINTIARAPKYSVTWKNYDGSTLETDNNVVINSIADYNEATPTRPATNEYTYTFAGWATSQNGTPILESNLPKVTANATYYAIYTQTKNKYTITWKDYNNEVLKTESVEYGVTPSFGTNPTRDATAEYTYTFKGWTPNLEVVTKNATYTATYTETKNTYTIKFVVNGQVAQQETLAYGTAISYKQTTPTKAPTSEYTYTFSGWALTENGEVVDSLGTVSGDITLYAIFTATQIPVSSSSSSTPSSSISSTKPSSSSKVESSSSSNAPSSSSSNEIISSENSSYSKEESSISSAISSSSTQNNSSNTPISSNSAKPTTRPTSGGCGANFGSTLGIISLLLVVGSIVFITKKKRN